MRDVSQNQRTFQLTV